MQPSPVVLRGVSVVQRIFSRIPRPVIILAAIAIGIPALLYVLKGPSGGTPTRTKSEFELVESAPSDQQNATPVIARPTFVFSKKIGVSERELEKYFTMVPKVEGSWHIEKNGQVVYFTSGKKKAGKFPQTFDYQTAYSVTIDKRFHSENGKELAGEENITFRTQQNPEFSLKANKSILPVPVGDTIDIEIQDYGLLDKKYAKSIQQQTAEPYKVTLQKATKDELLSYFIYKKNSYLAVNIIPDTLVRRAAITTTGQYMAKGQNGYSKVIRVSNPAFKAPGIYFVTFSNKYGRDSLFVVISKHVAQVIHDNKQTFVMTTDSNTNKAVGGIKVEYYKTQNKVALLGVKSTSAEGIAQQDNFSDDTDFVVTSRGNDIAVTSTRGYRMGLASDKESEVFSYTDRPVYRPGDTVHYKAVIRVRDGNGDFKIERKKYYVKYQSSYDASKGDYKEVAVDENGTLSFDTVVPFSENKPYPGIYLASKNTKGEYLSLDTLQLAVEYYKKPDMDISVSANEKEYISGDTSHMTVTGKTNYGKPLSGVKFSYRVMLVDYQEEKDRNDERIEKDIYSNYYGGGKELANGSSEFDKNGKASIEFSTKLPDSFIQSQVALLEVTPTIGAIPSFGKIVRLIHRGEFALFFDGIEANTSTGLSGYTVALDHNNPRKAVGNMKGKLTLTKKEYYSDNGQVIETRDIELDGKGRAGFAFRNLKEGSYEVKSEFLDARGNRVTGTLMTYVGAPVQLSGTTNVIGVSFDKPKYNAGETARATVVSNFLLDDVYVVIAENKGGATRIVSVEKRSEEERTSSFTISIPVRKETVGSVGVLLYTVAKGEVMIGQNSFIVERKNDKLTTNISFDKKRYTPGEKVTVKITTKDASGKGVSADNSLSLIDAALLQLGKLKTGIVEQFTTKDTYIALSHYDSLTGIYAEEVGGGGGCFLEGTQILMGDGTAKNIEDIRIGDMISTKLSETSKEMIRNTVEKTFAHTVTEYLLINNRLKVTPIHRIYLNGHWAEASEAKVGDMLLDVSGAQVEITSITKNIGIFRVYNLTTNPSHTFFADGMYVHNEKGLDPRQNFVDTLYWNPHIKTDSNGEATVSFKLADNVTTFTAQAFSNTKDSLFGEGTASIVSYKDLTIIPSLSAFYYEHDKPVISVIAQNSTGSDMDLTIVSGIKELSGENKQDIHVKGNDLEVIDVPFDLRDLTKNATFIVEARDRSGKVVDSVLMKIPILPQGNISARWESFENSYDHVFQPEFPSLDANRMEVSIVPNAAAKLAQPYYGISTYLSTQTGQQLFAYSYILARTRDGFIDPASYNYAQDVNEFRDAIETLSEGRVENTWTQSEYNNFYGGDSFESANLWVAMGFEKAIENKMLDEVTNAREMVDKTKVYFKDYGGIKPPPPPPFYPMSPTPAFYPTPVVSLTPTPVASLTPTPSTTSSGIVFAPPPPPPVVSFPPAPTVQPYYQPYPMPPVTRYYTDNEKLVRTLLYGQSFPDELGSKFNETPEGLASQILLGKENLMQKLLSLRITSASDRYIWSGYTTASEELPVLAIVEKGTLEDAEKAIRGISFTEESAQPLTLYAAVKYAERKNITISKPTFKVLVNGENAFEFPSKENDNNAYQNFTQALSTRSSKDGKLHLEVKSSGGLPIYGTVSEFIYTGAGHTVDSDDSYKADIQLVRSFRDIESGQTVSSIGKGKTGVVVFSSEPQRLLKTGDASYALTYLMEDMIAPNNFYLDQSQSYYDPQFQSVLKKLFPSNDNSQPAYELPGEFTDQTVFYNRTRSRVNLPYVVFSTSDGTYYRPKTSIVFPILGVVANEK